MKTLTLFACLCFAISTQAQNFSEPPAAINSISFKETSKKDIRLGPGKWKITSNHLITGGLVFLAGAAKGFNETLQFHWKEFHRQFPHANPQWYNPAISWRNKYKNGDAAQGPKSFLSTSVLIMFTDQYHLNNFINKMSWGTALVVKLGEGKKPLKHYLLDFLYYAVCNQAGFATTYYPFSKYKGK
jgi:hypothetical protein